MTRVTIYSDHNPQKILWQSDQLSLIEDKLATLGIHFERWLTKNNPIISYDTAIIAKQYGATIQQFLEQYGYKSWDIVAINNQHPDKKHLRQQFLAEHHHNEDEVRFFIEGEGLFYIHLNQLVIKIHCTKNDLIAVPATTLHWFDMGEEPNFVAIRFFNNQNGWLAKPSGSNISEQYQTSK